MKLIIYLQKEVPDKQTARDLLEIVKTKLAEHVEVLTSACIEDIEQLWPVIP